MEAIGVEDPRSFAGVVVISVFVVAYGLEMLSGHILKSKRPLRDALFTLMGIMSQSMLSGLVVGSIAAAIAITLWPSHVGYFSHVSFWIAFPIIFVTEEFLHYLVHRYAHEWRWLWKLHRTHHSGTDLNVGVVYRYNIFWVLLLPQSWMGAFAIYFGQGYAYVAAILVTYCVNVATHCSFRWDLWIREKCPWIEPFWRVLEKVITLPDAHHAHHAYGKTGHPNGNYAVTLFIFDVMFGTAKLPKQKQTQYGLPISGRLHWAEELFWPVIKKPLLPKPPAVAAQTVTQKS